jgi:hypothetical protein
LKFGGPGFNGDPADFEAYSDVAKGEQVSAGDSATLLDSEVNPGKRLSIIWSSEGDSATLANYDVPSS